MRVSRGLLPVPVVVLLAGSVVNVAAQSQRCVPDGPRQVRCYQDPTSLRPSVQSPAADSFQRGWEEAARERQAREHMRRDQEFQLELQRRQQEHELQLERMRQQGVNPR